MSETILTSQDSADSETEVIMPFVIDEESQTPASTKFSIVPHLLVLGAILFGLFATIIIPSTVAPFKTKSAQNVSQLPAPAAASVLPPVLAISDVPIIAKAAYVWDIKNQVVLYEKNAQEALPLASITKLMTALISYELAEDDAQVTISQAAARQESGGGIRWGETFSVKELADFALVSSYNSAAYMLAASAGTKLGTADPLEQFIAAMNITAKELGLNSLVYYNPTGLDVSATQAGSYGSAEDTSHLVEYILTHYPEILAPTMSASARIYNTAGQYHESDNTNDIISDIPNLLGSKTGYTDLAGGNLTIVFDVGYNHPVAITVLGSSYNGRFSDMKKLVAAVETAYEL